MFSHFTRKSVEKLSQRKRVEKVKKAKILLSPKYQKIEPIRSQSGAKVLETTQFPPSPPMSMLKNSAGVVQIPQTPTQH